MVDKHISSQGDFPFEWIPTKDGSFTLKPRDEGSEWMHSLQGAYSETQYIYGEALRQALSQWSKTIGASKNEDKTLHVFSLGLGLGYVEWIALLEGLKQGVNFHIHTYESEDALKAHFIENVHDEKLGFQYLKPHLQQSYRDEEIQLGLNVLKHNFSLTEVEDETKKSASELCTPHKVLSFYSALDLKVEKFMTPRCHIILYDAYSSKSQNEFWQQELLEKFLSQQADLEFCVFATYASTSALKKALTSKGFQLESKKGFAHKRESILAFRV